MTNQVLAEIAYTNSGSARLTLYTLGDHQNTVKDFAAVDAAIGSIANVGHRDYDVFGLLRSSN